MKFRYLFFLIFIPICFFGQLLSAVEIAKAHKEALSKRIYEEMRTYQKEQCYKDSLQAISDSKINYKYFINIAAPNGDEFLPGEELKEILKKHHIIWGGEWMGSDIGAYTNACYYDYMTKLTEDKFGKDFIDGLVRDAVASYVKKHPRKAFEENEHTEWNYKGTYLGYNNYDDALNIDFFKNFVYPEGYESYDPSSEKYHSHTTVTLSLDEKGNLLKKAEFHHSIYNGNNSKYIPYFEKEIKKFIKSTKFEPVKYRGYPIKCETSFFIYYK